MNPIQIGLMLLLFSLTVTATAKTDADKAAEQSLQAVTIFVDVNKLTRKHFAARKMTRSHNEFAAKGYALVSVSPYTENGDLEGFFVSYQLKRN